MKTLIMSLICTFTCLSLFAQVDSTNNNTNNTNNTNPTTVSPQTTTPTTNNNVTDSSSNMNSNNSNMNSTNSNMNSNNSSNMNSMNNKMDSSSMVNTTNPGQANYAALPVRETYIPDNILADVKQEHEGSYIYDITAVKAPMDSSMAQGNSMNQNSTAMNSTSTTTTNPTSTDSTNQNTTATTNATVNANSNTTMGGQHANTMSAPQEYYYVVRYLQGGTMASEKLDNNGTKISNP